MSRVRRQWKLALMDDDRSEKGWSFTDLAAESGMSVQSVTRFLRGEYRSPKTAQKIADALGHPLNRYLIRRVRASAS